MLAQAYVSTHGLLVGAASGRAARAGHPCANASETNPLGSSRWAERYHFHCQPKPMYRVTVGWWEPRPDTLLGWTSGRQCLRNKKDYKLIKPILNSRCDTNFTKTQRICHNPAQTRTNGPGYVMFYKFSRWPSPLKVQGPNPALAVAVLRAYIPDSRTSGPPRSHRPPVNLCFSLQQPSEQGILRIKCHRHPPKPGYSTLLYCHFSKALSHHIY